jgi:hypothetical protein
MAVAMKVDCASAHIAPNTEGVMTQHVPYTLDNQFYLSLHAVPFVTLDYSSIVVVADDEVLSAIQRTEQELYAFSCMRASDTSRFMEDRKACGGCRL